LLLFIIFCSLNKINEKIKWNNSKIIDQSNNTANHGFIKKETINEENKIKNKGICLYKNLSFLIFKTFSLSN